MRKVIYLAIGIAVLGVGACLFLGHEDPESEQAPRPDAALPPATSRAPAPAETSSPGVPPFETAAPASAIAPPPEEAGRIEGDVRDERGGAVSAARVALVHLTDGRPGGPPTYVAADGTGRFLFAGVPAGALRLIAIAPDDPGGNSVDLQGAVSLRATQPVEARVAAGQVTTVHLVIARGLPLSGIVKDRQGAVAPGAMVFVTLADSATPAAAGLSLRTREDGAFSAFVKDGDYLLSATAANGRLTQRKPARARAGNTSIQLIVEPAPRILGRVIRGDGSPVTAYWVSLKRGGSFTTPVSAPDGRFSVEALHGNLSGIDQEGALVVSVKIEGMPPAEKSVWFDGSPEIHVPDFVVADTRRVAVMVLDHQSNQPVGGAAVEVQDRTPDSFGTSMARTQITLTEENGRVDKEVPAAGATLRITHYKYAPAIATVGAGQGEITVLLDAGGAVTGHVTDSAGRPVIDALVVVSAGSFFRAGAVDAQGRYFIPHLAAGAYSVTLQPHQAFRASLAGEHPELIQHATRAHVAGEQTRSADVPAIGEALVDFAIAGAGR